MKKRRCMQRLFLYLKSLTYSDIKMTQSSLDGFASGKEEKILHN
jgi:hypothetical protein